MLPMAGQALPPADAVSYLLVVLVTAGVTLVPTLKRRRRDELKPILKIVDKIDHDMAVLRREIGAAQAHTERTATTATEFHASVERRMAAQGEALAAEVSRLRESVARIVTDHLDEQGVSNAE